MIELIDSHAHLDDAAFDPDRAEVIARAQQRGVIDFVVPAVSASGFEKLAALTQTYRWRVAYGLHPINLNDHRPAHLDQLKTRLADAVAVGECGLDFFLPNLEITEQRFYFHAQIKLALDFDLPLIIHARRAHEEVLQTLKRYRPKGGVIHSFAGSREQADALNLLNFKIGIGGPVTYPRAQRLREVVRRAPLESLLLETDAPDQPLSGRQGKRNDPEFLTEVLATVAELRDESADAIAVQTTESVRSMFTLRPITAAMRPRFKP